jgi:inner membrane protein
VPSSFSHAVVGIAIASAVHRTPTSKGVLATAGLCAIIPDIDLLWSRFGNTTNSLFMHRGITHSLFFAGALSGIVALIARPIDSGRDRSSLWISLALATASHGVLDALTAYGPGVAFFAPFSLNRLSFPWRPLGAGRIHANHSSALEGIAVTIFNELLWIWLPAFLLAGLLHFVRHRSRQPASR